MTHDPLYVRVTDAIWPSLARKMRRKAMMRAIMVASQDVFDYVEKTPRHAGLYAIRSFERANGVVFDPFDTKHLYQVRCNGRFSRLFAIIERRHALRWGTGNERL